MARKRPSLQPACRGAGSRVQHDGAPKAKPCARPRVCGPLDGLNLTASGPCCPRPGPTAGSARPVPSLSHSTPTHQHGLQPTTHDPPAPPALEPWEQCSGQTTDRQRTYSVQEAFTLSNRASSGCPQAGPAPAPGPHTQQSPNSRLQALAPPQQQQQHSLTLFAASGVPACLDARCIPKALASRLGPWTPSPSPASRTWWLADAPQPHHQMAPPSNK